MSPASLSVNVVTLKGQPRYFDSPFPHVLRNEDPGATLEEVTQWVAQNRDALESQAAEQGAVLFRGFPIRTDRDFDAFIRAFGFPNFPYEESLSNAVRVNRTERVFTANEAPPEVNIYLHHEMAQTPVYPSKLFFFCEKPAERGGATPLCRSDALLDALRDRAAQFVEDCETKGLKYSNVMPAETDAKSGMGRSWQGTFRAATRDEAEQRMRQLGYTWQWNEDGSLRATTPVLPAVRPLASGRKSFFNQLIAASRGWKDSRNDPSKALRFGDDSPLDTDAVELAASLAEDFTFDVPWQAGDVVLVDNFVVMHGRRNFEGKRAVLASLIR